MFAEVFCNIRVKEIDVKFLRKPVGTNISSYTYLSHVLFTRSLSL